MKRVLIFVCGFLLVVFFGLSISFQHRLSESKATFFDAKQEFSQAVANTDIAIRETVVRAATTAENPNSAFTLLVRGRMFDTSTPSSELQRVLADVKEINQSFNRARLASETFQTMRHNPLGRLSLSRGIPSEVTVKNLLR